MSLPVELEDSLEEMKYETPTPIQAQSIPLALKGRDILGSAQTGTGKTAAFGIPLVDHLVKNPDSTGLILTPTRELAMQVMEVLEKLIGKLEINTALLIGGAPMGKQLKQLSRKPRLVVGTPGRINDHLRRKKVDLSKATFLVLDETDRMLDMGFGVQIDEILRYVPGKRQTLLFSATLPKGIVRLAQKYLYKPERVAVDTVNSAAKNIKQDMVEVKESEKFRKLMDELDDREGSILVFVKTRKGTGELAYKLKKKQYKSQAVHGDMRQNQRERVIQSFRDKKCRILVATDVVARGLDIPHIEHVINYDLPQCPEDYIHRIGRTARAGAEGSSLCIVSPIDKPKWKAINRMLHGEEVESPQHSGRRKSFGNKRPFNKTGSQARRRRGSGGKGPQRQGKRPMGARRPRRAAN